MEVLNKPSLVSSMSCEIIAALEGGWVIILSGKSKVRYEVLLR